jgi:putative holliday junction resolvase
MARILGIDYGLKRSGLAVTDPLQIIASPLVTVPTNELVQYLENYMKKEQVETMVVGEPKNLDGSPSQIAADVEEFILQLEKKFPSIPVRKIDERFTSKIAQQVILQSGKNKMARRDKSLLDKVSAALILQSYLDSIK